MSYEVFKRKVNALVERVGGIDVRFLNDTEAGKFSAYCSDGTIITGNSQSLKVTVRWNGNHQSMAAI